MNVSVTFTGLTIYLSFLEWDYRGFTLIELSFNFQWYHKDANSTRDLLGMSILRIGANPRLLYKFGNWSLKLDDK